MGGRIRHGVILPHAFQGLICKIYDDNLGLPPNTNDSCILGFLNQVTVEKTGRAQHATFIT